MWTLVMISGRLQEHSEPPSSHSEVKGELFSNYKIPEPSKIRSERSDIIRQFLEEINKERIGTKWKLMTARGVAIKVGHLKDNHTLYFFLSQCKDYKNRQGSFSKYFFGALKVRSKSI